MKTFSITILLIVLTNSLSGQSWSIKIKNNFLMADSVIIVSHLTTYQPIIDDSDKKKRKMRTLVVKNKPNYLIIKEKYLLDKIEIDSISRILIEPNKDSTIEDIKCFIPHHGILIFKKGKCSFFDICFGCRHFVTSKDIKTSDELSERSWNKLELFFRLRNLNYGMDLDKIEDDSND